MATQQLPNSLPPGWESDYDGTSERWFFVHRPTGFTQFFFPKEGDEVTRLAELAQPQPTNGSAKGSLTIKMEALTISESTNTTVPTQPAVASQQPQQNNQTISPMQTHSAVPNAQQSPQIGAPIARTVSGGVQRKAIPRRESVQSQVSTHSSQGPPQPMQQNQQAVNMQTQSSPTQIARNAQQIHHGQQLQQPQQPVQIVQTGQMQQSPQVQQAQLTQQYFPNQQPLQTAQPQQYQQLVQNPQIQQPQQMQYQQNQPPQMTTGQPGQTPVYHQPVQYAQTISTVNQVQQAGQPQQIQQTLRPQIQTQYANTPSPPVVQQNGNVNQRRFSTIPVLHQPNNGQVSSSPPPVQQPLQGTRHSSIGTNGYQSQPLTQGQQIQQPQFQQMQNGQILQTYTSPMQQSLPSQPPPGSQYVQQSVATTPQNLPPAAPGMQWVLVQPGTQSGGVQPQTQPIQNAQPTFDPSKSNSFAEQTRQFGGPALAARPGLITRLSSSTTSGSKKALDASKGFVKKNPGKTMALVGGLGLVAEACGVSVISDVVAGSKVYANVQNAKARKKLLNAQKPTQQAATTLPSTNVIPQVAQPLSQVLHQQYPVHQVQMVNGVPVSHSIGHVGLNAQQIIQPMHQIYQQASHHHNQHQHHTPQFQQNMQPTDPSQYIQAQPAQPQYTMQQNPDGSIQYIQTQNPQPQYVIQQNPQDGSIQYVQSQSPPSQFGIQQNPQGPLAQYIQAQNAQPQFAVQQNPQISQPQLIIQDNSGQGSQGQNSGNLVNYAQSGINMFSGQTNPPNQSQSQSQSPSLPFTDNQVNQQPQQLPAPSASPFDPSQQQQQFSNFSPATSPFDTSSQQAQQFPGLVPSSSPFDPSQLQQPPAQSASPFDPSQLQQPPVQSTSPFDLSQLQQPPAQSTSPFDPSQLQQPPAQSTSPFDASQSQQPSTTFFDPSQYQQFATSSTPPIDPSTQLLQLQLQDQASTDIANQAIAGSQQFTNDLMGQSIPDTSIQDDNSYITSSSPVLVGQVNTDFDGQSILNASIQDDNSYINPPSPTLLDTSNSFGQGLDYDDTNAMALNDDMSAAIF